MKILFILEQPYARIDVIIKGLRQNGIEIIECINLSASHFIGYPNVLGKFILKRKKDFDLIFVGFFGQPFIPIIKKLTNKPIMLDAFFSIYDTMCFDRQRFKPKSLCGRFLYWLDKHSCELSDNVLLDTDAHINYFVDTFGLEREKFQRIFVSADDSIFYPRKAMEDGNKFKVFYYGTYHPLQGIEHIIGAAKKLEHYMDIEFKIVGKGMQHKKIMKFVQELDVRNITFINWIPYETLPLEIAKADVCLGGHFSSIDKARRVISGKTFHFIAMKKPVIIGDNLANRELFEDKKNALFVEMGNEDALADAILELKDNVSLREKIAEEGYKTFKEKCTPRIIGEEIKEIMEEVLDKRG